MGNYRFRLSDMMPNAWFYKLKDMGKARNHQAAAAAHSVKKRQTKSATMTQPSNPKQPHQNSQLYPRKSYYFTRELGPSDRFYNSPPKPKSTDTQFPVEQPRKSSKQRRLRRRPNRSGPKLVSSSVSAGCSCRATIWTNKADSPPPGYSSSSSPIDNSSPEPGIHENLHVVPELRSDCVLVTESFDEMVAWSNSCSCRVDSSAAKDIVIDVDKKPAAPKFGSVDGFDFDSLSELELPRIITKPAKVSEDLKKTKETNEPTKYRRSSAKFEEKNANGSLSVKVVKEEKITTKEEQHKTSPVKRCSMNSPGGVRLRLNSPKIASRKIQGRRSTSSTSSSSSRKSNLSDSLAIVKSSFDPQRDFRDSMVEMIVENNIRASKDLEDLLACYLSLNSDEYHELIIKVFKQIWFDLTAVRFK
ncbi:hypothetical protein ACOSP7_029117 [Xanthoceras sorbifolium]